MKTNHYSRMFIALLAVVILCFLSAAVFAETGTVTPAAGSSAETEQAETTTETTEIISTEISDTEPAEPAGTAETGSETPDPHSAGRGKHRNDGHRKDRERSEQMEDWFEGRIEARGHKVDFSKLPENPTDEEIVEFFKENFMGEADSSESAADGKEQQKSGKKSREHAKKHARLEDWFEDWFEDHIEKLEKVIDFSSLPEDPTDEEMFEFFKENYLGKDHAQDGDGSSDAEGKKGPDSGKNGHPFPGHRSDPRHPFGSGTEQEPESGTLPEAAPAEESTESAEETA